MTKTLPPSADIEWLRKAAKSLLKTWRAEGRDAKLADAQYNIAQDYGFTSWRALKARFDGGIDPATADAFLRIVGNGDLDAMRVELGHQPALANACGKHPFWGGRPHTLHVAIDTNRPEAMDLLLDAGAKVEGPGADYDNWSPLMLALSWERAGMVQELRERGAMENICTALLSADDAALDRFLATTDWRFERLPSGSLIGLARTPHAVHQLINAGVSPEGQDRWGADAMETLSRLGSKGRVLVDALASHGTEISAENLARLGDRDRLMAVLNDQPGLINDPKVITAAVDFGHVELVDWLLRNGADVNARQSFGSEGTALHSAAWNADMRMVECLLRHGADTTAIDREHETTPHVWAQVARRVTNNPKCDDVARLLADYPGAA